MKNIWKKLKWKMKNILFNLFHKKEHEKHMKKNIYFVSEAAAGAAKARNSRLQIEEIVSIHEDEQTLRIQNILKRNSQTLAKLQAKQAEQENSKNEILDAFRTQIKKIAGAAARAARTRTSRLQAEADRINKLQAEEDNRKNENKVSIIL